MTGDRERFGPANVARFFLLREVVDGRLSGWVWSPSQQDYVAFVSEVPDKMDLDAAVRHARQGHLVLRSGWERLCLDWWP